MLRKNIHPLEKNLQDSIYTGELEKVKSCITAIKESKDIPAPSINVTNEEYFSTPLMLAATRGKVAIVKLLLESGADKDVKNKNGRTVLDIARRDAAQTLVNMSEPYRCTLFGRSQSELEYYAKIEQARLQNQEYNTIVELLERAHVKSDSNFTRKLSTEVDEIRSLRR